MDPRFSTAAASRAQRPGAHDPQQAADRARARRRARTLAAALAATLALAMASLTLAARPAAALALIDPSDAAWSAALAAGRSTGFDHATPAGTGVDAGFASLRAMSPAAVMPDYDPRLPGGNGGSIGLENMGAGAWGTSGMAVSTLDLAWPYGLVIDFDVAVTAFDAVWAAANADWQATAFDAAGGLIGRTVIPGFDADRSPVSGGTGEVAGRAAVALSDAEAEAAVGGGISRLELRSLGGYDWLYLDDLRVATAMPGAEAGETPTPGALRRDESLAVSEVPLPPAALLLGGGLLALLRVGRRRGGRGGGRGERAAAAAG
ncbi:hypothetical protein SAMN05444336_10244 [Albimonas donghaensis]|uniref:Uncharacterized protein n=1 Tax=Albimonas donghaensis TaxID=356660 RepID=A0A1H2VEH5_9RHOB|nr:hypothetical protein [Albimonas donghaensis]SDW66737.1 hypothetical protein SAMN05444336_10244 [Albimonas donghaensis]